MTQAATPQSKPAADYRSRLRAASREKLLNSAERLFAERGIAGVSLREIAVAAGQKNNSAVHYYFDDKQGIVDALIADRIAKVEQLRSRELARMGDLAKCDAEAILRMLWQPMLDLCTGQDGTWIIKFHLSYHLSNPGEHDAHPIIADPEHHPASGELLAALAARFPDLSSEELRYRQGLVFVMFWMAVSRYSAPNPADSQGRFRLFSLDGIIRMSVAVLAA